MNLQDTPRPDERYVGSRGTRRPLDHVLTSSTPTPTSFDAVHVNAEFVAKASDHDPLVAHA